MTYTLEYVIIETMNTYDGWVNNELFCQVKAHDSMEARYAVARKYRRQEKPSLLLTEILPYVSVRKVKREAKW